MENISDKELEAYIFTYKTTPYLAKKDYLNLLGDFPEDISDEQLEKLVA